MLHFSLNDVLILAHSDITQVRTQLQELVVSDTLNIFGRDSTGQAQLVFLERALFGSIITFETVFFPDGLDILLESKFLAV